MPSILNLKFKGNKSFVAFSNLNDTESLTKTWKVCTKVASFLEQGQRLENLSWRLWHLQSLMVDTDNAKSKREFKKLSKCMGDKLDKEKGRSIEELEAPDFRRNPSTDMIQQRAVEKERNREANQNTKPGHIKRMQFTFSVDQHTPSLNFAPVNKPDLKPSPEFMKPPRRSEGHDDRMVVEENKDPPPAVRGRKPASSSSSDNPQSLHFPPLFSNDFGPSALLYPTPTPKNCMSYGEGVNYSSSNSSFNIVRPTIEVSLDELLQDGGLDIFSTYRDSSLASSRTNDDNHNHDPNDVEMQTALPTNSFVTSSPTLAANDSSSSSSSGSNSSTTDSSDDEGSDYIDSSVSSVAATFPYQQPQFQPIPKTVAPAKVNPLYARSATPTRPHLTLRTTQIPARATGLSATVSNRNGGVTPTNVNSAPGGVKAECSNCGATHTPLWRRGLNDELNCNACGLYCKLHKRPRPKSMRNSHGEGRAQAAPRPETVDVMAQCYNCHTTATPLWRKDDEGKTVCNACGLYYKLHGSARPISMKSDVIRKRSRHDARRAANGHSDTPSASPGVSRRASPIRESSPTLAPDSTTQMNYDFSVPVVNNERPHDFRSNQSELMGALDENKSSFNPNHIHNDHLNNMFSFQFPGPYHPELMTQFVMPPPDPLPFAPDFDFSDMGGGAQSPRMSKRRRMSTDSASEPPSSAVSYSSYDGYSSASSATSHSQRSSMDFPFSNFPNLTYLHQQPFRGSSSTNTFWHPPMLPGGNPNGNNDNSPNLFHPPMLPPSSSEDSPMDYLHPPMSLYQPTQEDENLFYQYLHPPMTIPDEQNVDLTYPSSGGNGEYDTHMGVY